MSNFRRIGMLLSGALLATYPLAVYFGLQFLQPRVFGFMLAAMLVLRLFSLRHHSRRLKPLQFLPALCMMALCVVSAIIFNTAQSLRLLPVAINAICLMSFAYTLLRPPSMIEQFARLREPDLDASAIRYTRNVTKIWCVFFLINGGIALYTALVSSLAVWTLYNGLIAYGLMGLLFAVEYIVRGFFKRRHAEQAA
jgi:uncharacterized membrane protein